jgi:hypothetical protein
MCSDNLVVSQIVLQFGNTNSGDCHINAALDEAIAYLQSTAERFHGEARDLRHLSRHSRAPGAKTVGNGLRQRARVGDEEAATLLKKLGVSREGAGVSRPLPSLLPASTAGASHRSTIAALKAQGIGATAIAKRLRIGRASVYRVLQGQ